MQTFNSIYLGIVVQNNDPEYRGRIKVWVPYISATVYNKWNELKQDQVFSVPGTPGGENISAIIEDLKDVLPWAEHCSPILGASSTGYYNRYFDVNTPSDASFLFSQPGTNYTETSSATNIDPERKGGKPGALYENYPVGDAFGNTAKINSQYVNQFAENYKPSTYSNAAKGLFSVPNVGSHVWVFFREGIPHYPVYMGTSFGQEDFESIFKNEDGSKPDYPDTFENRDKRTQPEFNADVDTYRNKLVLNQRGAAIEIINTTDRETYKVTHFSGGYYEMNNKFTALFNPENFQLLTQKDKFETIRGHSNYFVGRDSDNIIQGDYWLKIGLQDPAAFDTWNALMLEITTAAQSNPGVISTMLASLAEDFADAEKQTGFGGNSFETIAKHKTVNVGFGLNYSPAIYYNSASPILLVTSIRPGGVKENTAYPTLEQLYVPDTPGGNYSISVGNKFSVDAGAGGLSLKTAGVFEAGGEMVDVRGAGIFIGGQGIQIGAENYLSLTGKAVYLKNTTGGQVVVDSNLGVTSNVMIGGGSYTNGEVYLNHITAPIEYQVTESTKIKALPGRWRIRGTLTGAASPASTTSNWPITIGNVFLEGGTLEIDEPHSHVFKNVPLTLLPDTTSVAAAAESTVNVDSPAATIVTAPSQNFLTPKYSLPPQIPFPTYNGVIKPV